jgi:hypothetical protein
MTAALILFMRYYARAFPPAGGSTRATTLLDRFYRARDWYLAQPRFSFEAMTFGAAVLVGLLVMPALIFVAGSFTLQSYDGGLLSLYYDFFKGLLAPQASFWFVVAGPFVFLTLVRLFRLALSKIRKT